MRLILGGHVPPDWVVGRDEFIKTLAMLMKDHYLQRDIREGKRVYRFK